MNFPSAALCLRALGGYRLDRHVHATLGLCLNRFTAMDSMESEYRIADPNLIAVIQGIKFTRLQPLTVEEGAVDRMDITDIIRSPYGVTIAWIREACFSSKTTSASPERPIRTSRPVKL